jgi:regulator of RNase E activity RraA
MSTLGARRFPSPPQAAAEDIEQLRKLAVALVSDSMHRGTGSMGDNLATLRAFDYCRPGDILVVDAGGDVSNAIVGGIITAAAAMLGLAGFVLDGAIRDVAEIREREFPVYARGVTHRGPYKNGPGEINVPVNIGGMVVNPGDIIIGDQDGLLAFPAADAKFLIAKAQAQHAAEERQMEEIRQGRWDRAFVDGLEAKSIN